ncbi:Gibberellin 2-beta-dioxygenase [Vitis vinifera]|uniref:Gibberellin 2-beta-dioxygenase n=1 Tax=Vitis vinifera TaxID=29760 RepID=A0A438JPC6_VITVI|nr:Gibberellin 2-beta-dioxygenase [Vitis vinifera]
MVVLSQNGRQQLPLIKACKPNYGFTGIPVIDMTSPHAKAHMVEACEEFGFFKLVNHGVPMEFMSRLEDEGRIGPNGDVGWIEYLLLSTNPDSHFPRYAPPFPRKTLKFSGKKDLGLSECGSAVVDYVSSVKNMTYEVLEMIAEGLNIEPRNVLSRLLKDEESDSCFRVNHYPPCPELEALRGRVLVGFGEHTDPQIISVLRSNNTNGLEICLKDGTWVSVPPDQDSFFINVGDSLQVMTNGKFKSVKHRVVTESRKARVSMIYFGGPPLTES